MRISRRKLMWSAAPAGVMPHRASAQSSAADFPKADGLTLEVANFIRDTGYRDIPDDVLDLGKKSILDGLGLALCGSMAETGVICGWSSWCASSKPRPMFGF